MRTEVQGQETTRADIALLQRIAARDAGAVAELYDRHSRLLYGLILRILRDRGEAEEVLQEVFVVAWDRVATYNAAIGSPAGWLVGIARNRAIDRLRANAVRRRAVDAVRADLERTEPLAQAGPLDHHQRAIAQALDAIPPEQRQLIEDAYFLGFTHSELAERHQLPLGTVKTRIRSGLLALRERLSQIGIEP